MKQFDYVQAQKPKRSAFDLSHRRVTTLNPAEITPILCKEILPGDTFNVNMETFLRTMPLISPVMHHVNLYAHAFFVPTRLLMNKNETKFEDFITGKVEIDLPSWKPSFFFDADTPEDIGKNSLIDHLNYGLWDSHITEAISTCKPMSQMPLRAYHKIWNDYYRDQNFQPEFDFDTLVFDMSDYQDRTYESELLFKKHKRCFEKDYFTSALLTQQRGSAVNLPIGSLDGPVRMYSDTTHQFIATGAVVMNSQAELSYGAGTDLNTKLVGDIGSTTITQLRQAFALQRWYEASMRFGQRYVEQLLGLFGVVSKDARLQRAEFINGGRLPVQIGEVLQTSQTAETPQGTMAGKAISIGNIINFNRTFDEHGYLMVLVSILPRTAYNTFCDRQNLKLSQFDFAFPQFAHLSEQPIYNQEIFQDNNATMENPFGYQPVYSEYRYEPDSYHGELKDTLSFWGLGRDFVTQPTLSEEFVEGSFPQDIFAVPEGDNQAMLLQSFAKITAIRPLPKFGTPI